MENSQTENRERSKESTSTNTSSLQGSKKDSLDFTLLEDYSDTNRFERMLNLLEKKGREVEGIKMVVGEAIKNLHEEEKSFVIYGEPQSGKTEMMITLTAKLLDEGAKIIIVLLTDNISLLNQNLNRFCESGINPAPKKFEEVLGENVEMGENKWIIFCKKNSSNLNKLIQKLESIPKKIIIDDEADYATPNSKVNKEEEKSKINSLTKKLIGTDGSYIGVTATPARLDLNNTHQNDNEKWIHLPPHSNYTGQDIFFPIDKEHLDYRLTLLDDSDDPQYLEEALFRFLINVAHLNTKINIGTGEINYSFLIHTSGKIDDHNEDYKLITNTFNILGDSSNQKHQEYYKRIFRLAKELYSGEEQDIIRYIHQNNRRNKILVINSKGKRNEESGITIPSTLFTILIGGNIISRGVTFENLLSMYFTRKVKHKYHQDTYIQRARMFGSRGEYLKFFELTIPEDLYLDWHDCFVFHRLSLESINTGTGAPIWVQGGNVAVTGGSSIDNSTVFMDSGEMGFCMMDINVSEFKDLFKDTDNTQFIQSINRKYGAEVLPNFLLNYIKKTSSIGSIKISNPVDITGWKDANPQTLERPKGFISTSSKDFNDYDHHIQPVFNPKTNKAKFYYKPTRKKLSFLKNLKKK